MHIAIRRALAGCALAGLLPAIPLLAAAAPKAGPPAKIITMPDGLQYADLVVGKGAHAQAGHDVKVSYVGKLKDGTTFDASANHGDGTFSFPLGAGQVIKGWDEGVASMRVGGVRRLIIPPSLGYGASGAGDAVPPNATLIFEVTLISVAK